MSRVRKSSGRVSKFLLSLSSGLAGLALATSPQAMEFHIFGDKIYASGEVEAGDGARLQDLYERATASGRTIGSVVFRNSPGGAAIGGLEMAAFIRDMGLNTVFQGGCYSACATAFTGGVERGVAAFDLPSQPLYDKTTLGYHGGSINGVPADDAIQQALYDFDVLLFGPDADPEMLKRIHTAHFDIVESNGFLRYLDPNASTAAAIFCPTGDWLGGDETGCAIYQGVDYYSDGVVTQAGYQPIEDILNIRSTVSGDLNPNFGNDLADVYGVLRIGQGGTWSLATESFADITWMDGGRLNLQAGGLLNRAGVIAVGDGGVLNLDNGNLIADGGGLTVMAGGALTGTGSFYGLGTIFGTLAPDDLELRPYALSDRVNNVFVSALTLAPGSVTAISVDPSRTKPAISIVDAEVHLELDLSVFAIDALTNTHPYLLISPDASLAVNFTPGFYRPGQKIPLIAQATDSTALQMPEHCSDARWTCVDYDRHRGPAPAPQIIGHYDSFIRINDGKVLALDENGGVDIISVGEDSLLSFALEYDSIPDVDLGDGTFWRENSRGLYLTVQRAFDDIGLFGNERSGDGLGVAIRNASDKANPGIEPLLGALQFATRSAVVEQSGALRGDGFVTLQLADRGLVGMLDSAQRQQRFATGSGNLGLALNAESLSGMGVDDMAMNGDAMLRYLVAENEPGVGAAAASGTSDGSKWNAWGRVLAGVGDVETRQGVEGAGYDYTGVMLGAERTLKNGRGVVGGSLAYVSNDLRSPSDRFRSDGDAVSGALYADLNHAHGEFEASARYTRLNHDTVRTIQDIAGLEAPNRDSFDTDAWSVHAQHAYTLKTGEKAPTVRLLAPVVDYVGVSGYSVQENAGPAALTGQVEDFDTLRAGAGFDIRGFWAMADGGEVVPHARIVYQRQFGDDDAVGSAAFLGEPNLPFAVRSQTVGDDVVSVNLGVTLQRRGGLALAVEYAGEASSDQSRHGGFVGLSYRF